MDREPTLESLQRLTARLPGMVYQMRRLADGWFHFPFVSEGIQALFELTPSDVRYNAAPLFLRIDANDRRANRASLAESARTLQPWQAVYRAILPSGMEQWHATSAVPYLEPDGAVAWYGNTQDVTERVRTERALQIREAQLRQLVDSVPGRLWFKDLQGRFVLGNDEVARAFGVATADLQGKTVRDLSANHDKKDLQGYEVTDQQALASGTPLTYETEYAVWPGGPKRSYSVVKRVIYGANHEPLGILGIAQDITESKQNQLEIERLAFYDSLTGLCNRRLFRDRLEKAQVASSRGDAWGAVCFIDLDNFKDLNDTLGHHMGDALLTQVAERLQQTVREQDTVARLGGDEFVVLLENLDSERHPAAVAAHAVGQKILKALNQPYILGDHPLINTPSVGITLFRGDSETVDEVLKRADLAMYQSKAAGRNTVRFFDPDMQAVVVARSSIERDLRHALREQEFQLFYQPVVDAEGVVLAYEALLRWKHPVRGWVSPADFIPVAEQTALILPIGLWVLETASRRLAQWAADPATSHWVLAVNLSARQLRQPDLVETVVNTLKAAGAPAHRLKLELTEGLLLHDLDDTIEKMRQLAELGIRFALDDFGTGYSSLAYLKRLPLSQLKIDQSFVRDLLTDPNDAAIARTILQLAQSLDLDVVAEGVETAEQRDCLAAMGCPAFQGYLFGRPAPMD